MIPGLLGELGKGGSHLKDLAAMVCERDSALGLVDQDVAEVVVMAMEAGMTWGALAEVLRGDRGEEPHPDHSPPSGHTRAS